MSNDCAHNNREYIEHPGLNHTIIVEVKCATCGAYLGSYQKT